VVQARFGGKKGVVVEFVPSEEFLVVRTARRNPLARATLTARGRSVVAGLGTATRFAAAGVEIVQAREGVDAAGARDVLKEEADLGFPRGVEG